MTGVGQDCTYTLYTAVSLAISLPKTPYIHLIYIVLANLPTTYDIFPAVRGFWVLAPSLSHAGGVSTTSASFKHAGCVSTTRYRFLPLYLFLCERKIHLAPACCCVYLHNTHTYIGLARTIYTRCTYGIFGRNSQNIWSYTMYIYGCGQLFTYTYLLTHTHTHTLPHTCAHTHTQGQAEADEVPEPRPGPVSQPGPVPSNCGFHQQFEECRRPAPPDSSVCECTLRPSTRNMHAHAHKHTCTDTHTHTHTHNPTPSNSHLPQVNTKRWHIQTVRTHTSRTPAHKQSHSLTLTPPAAIPRSKH